MSPNPTDPRDPRPDDALLQRYQEANALDTTRPGAALRESVLAHAHAHAARQGAPIQASNSAANDKQWKLRALASLAVLGLVGMLVMQFERGTPEEQEVALGAPSSRTATPATQAPMTPSKPEGTPLAEPEADAVPEPPSANKPVPSPPGPAPEAKSTLPLQDSASRSSGAAATPTSPLAAQAPANADGIAPMIPAEPAVVVQTPPSMARVAPAAAMDEAPAMTQIEAPAPMATAPSSARERPAMSESRKTSRREFASEDALGSTRDATSPQDLPRLHVAVASGDLEKVRSLLAQGANINARDRQGRTALMLAAMGTSKDLVTVLMSAGADATLRDSAGLSAADHAARAGHTDWLPLLAQPLR